MGRQTTTLRGAAVVELGLDVSVGSTVVVLSSVYRSSTLVKPETYGPVNKIYLHWIQAQSVTFHHLSLPSAKFEVFDSKFE